MNLVVGSLILGIPKLIKLFGTMATTMNLTAGALGVITLGLTAVVAAIGTLVSGFADQKKQDEAFAKFASEREKAMSGLANEYDQATDAVLAYMEAWLKAPFSDKDKQKIQDIVDAIKSERDAWNQASQAQKDYIQNLESQLETNIQSIKNYYGDYKTEISSLVDKEKEAHQIRMDNLSTEIDKVQTLHDKNVQAYKDTYQTGINALTDEVQAQIDFIDKGEEADSRARRKKELEDRASSIRIQLLNTRKASERIQLENDLASAIQDIAEQENQWEVQDQKDKLRKKIEAIQNGTDAEAIALGEVKDTAIKSEDDTLKTALDNIETKKNEEENYLQTRLIQIVEERDAFIEAQQAMTKH